MANGFPILPRTINTDLDASYLPDGVVRFIKNLTIRKGANGTSITSLGQNQEKQKPLQGNQLYAPFTAPEGTNYCIGACWFDVVNEIYVWAWNSLGNHFIYRILCEFGTIEMVKVDRNFKFLLQPEYFIHENGCILEPVKIVDPTTGNETLKKDLYFTDGYNYQGYLRVDDCIATNGFDENLYPYFKGGYDKDILIRMGVPTLDDCIGITELPLTSTDNTLNNDILFQTWKFRAKGTDVFGRPTEHGIIAYYVPGINDCLSSSGNVSRCLNFVVKIDNPFIDTVDIEYLNDNGTVWYKTQTIYLYIGDKVNNWWLRQRNPDVIFDTETYELTTTFCADGEHEAVPQEETSRLYNPLPNSSVGIVKLTKRICLFNNRIGFNPWNQTLISKFKKTIELPEANPATELVSLTFIIPIWCEALKNYQQVIKDGTNGYIWGDNNTKHNSGARTYDQYFKNIAQSGWQVYLNDGDSVITTQVYLDGNNNWIDDPLFNGMALSPTHMTAQKAVFTNKKKAHYIVRIASHLTDPTITANFQKTSTTVWGLCPYTKTGNTYNIDIYGREPSQEISVNACDGNYDTVNDTKILLIADLGGITNGQRQRSTSGYINETQFNGEPQKPMELMLVTGFGGYTSAITDHNGFYYFSTRQAGRSFAFNFLYKCLYTNFGIKVGDRGMQLVNIIIDEYIDKVNDPYSTTPLYGDYATLGCNRILIKGQAVLAGTNIGAANSLVTLTRGGSGLTDSNGNFTIIAHDDMHSYPVPRKDSLVFSSVCIYHAEDGGCIDIIDIQVEKCNPNNNCAERDLITSGWILTFDNFRGLLSGGSYRIGGCGADWLGRRQFIQDLGSLNIPTVAQTGVIAPCKVKINIDTDAIFPVKFKWFSLFITAELSNADYLEWIAGDVELIDNTGLVNTTNPTQIRIYYNSLNEYNKQNGYSTTTEWQVLVAGTANPVTGDKIQFIVNGDGSVYRTTIISLIKYDKEGQYILIDYKPSLATLSENAKFRLVHPKQSYSQNEPFYEICNSRVNLIDGVPDRFEFYLDAFDTYYLPRQIPVPSSLNNKTEVITETTTTTSGSVTTSTAVQTTQPVAYSNQLRTLGFYFEHHSPSNFWGLHCWNYGRANVRNVDEAELINFNEVALSGELLPTGVLSYLQYFDRKLALSFDIKNTLGIIGALVMLGRVIWVTQKGNFATGYNDNLLRNQPDGTISVNAANGFGSPDTTVDPQYGCLLRDKNTIQVRNDSIIFLDTTLCELVGLRPTSTGGTIHYTKNSNDLLLISKIKSVMGTNRYFHGGVNPLTDEYLLSDFNLDSISYINQERWWKSEVNETWSFDINKPDLLGTFMFTPEQYAFADGDIKNKNLFSFKNAIPYNHYSLSQNTVFNTFYGVVGERVLVVVHNAGIMDEKSFKWIEVYSKFLYYAYKIETDTGQISRLNKKQWLRTVSFYKAAFLAAINSPNVNKNVDNLLFNGVPLYGRAVTVHLCGDAVNNSQYSELSGIIIFSTKIEKSGVK